MIHKNVPGVVCLTVLPIVAMAQGGAAPPAPLALPTKIALVSILSALVGTSEGQKDL